MQGQGRRKLLCYLSLLPLVSTLKMAFEPETKEDVSAGVLV